MAEAAIPVAVPDEFAQRARWRAFRDPSAAIHREPTHLALAGQRPREVVRHQGLEPRTR